MERVSNAGKAVHSPSGELIDWSINVPSDGAGVIILGVGVYLATRVICGVGDEA